MDCSLSEEPCEHHQSECGDPASSPGVICPLSTHPVPVCGSLSDFVDLLVYRVAEPVLSVALRYEVVISLCLPSSQEPAPPPAEPGGVSGSQCRL